MHAKRSVGATLLLANPNILATASLLRHLSTSDQYSQVSPETPTPIRRKSGVLGCNFNNAKSQLGGFPFELSDLSLAVLVLAQFCSLVDVFHPVAKHTVDQSLGV
jgi:hypothetical protein